MYVIDVSLRIETQCMYQLSRAELFSEHRLDEGTSCACIYEEAVGQLEELPALCRVVAACCVGTTWQTESIVWREDVLCCCLGFGPEHTGYDAQKLSLSGPKESGGASYPCCELLPMIVRWSPNGIFFWGGGKVVSCLIWGVFKLYLVFVFNL